MKQATREMFRLESDLLRSHLLSQRYLHPTAWRSSYRELSSWLKAYNDHPDASRIFWLAESVAKNAAARPVKPGYLNGYGLVGVSSYRPPIPMYTGGRASPRTTRRVAREVRRNIRRGWPSRALEVIENERNRRYLTKVEEGSFAARSRMPISSSVLMSHRQARHGIGAARDDAFMATGPAGWLPAKRQDRVRWRLLPCTCR